MRLLHIFHDDRHAKRFSAYLLQQGIANNLEISKNNDWESENYGDPVCKVWIIDEDQVAQAKSYLESYRENPDRSEYISLRPDRQEDALRIQPPPPPRKRREAELGKASFVCIFLCALVLFISMISRAPFQPYPSDLPAAPLFLSKIEKEFYFDYPKAYELVGQLEAKYGLKSLIERKNLPPEGLKRLEEYKNTPYWKGIYPLLVSELRGEKFLPAEQPPLFEKIREGQLWRLATPIFLHADIFHLFFNMIWLFVLGTQMEYRLGMARYLLFILVTAIFSNVAQYLMSGPNFVGFSGVLCAMIAFVWVRQKKTPWEGYQLQRNSMRFVMLFIFAIFGFQCLSFLFEIAGQEFFSLPIANTAHLAGGLMGYLLGRSELFKKRSQ